MRDRENDEQWIRAKIGEVGQMDNVIYISPNHYDGGYEVRVGTVDFFVDYESIDGNDTAIIAKYL